MMSDERPRRRPGANVARDVVQAQLLRDLEVWRCEFRKWKLDGLVTLFDESPFRRPVRPDDIAVKAPHQRVDRGRDLEQVIGPQRDHSTRAQHAARLAPEARPVEPVQRLRHRHEINRGRGAAARFGRSDAVGDAVMGRDVLDLRRAGIGCADVTEVTRQTGGRLARTGARIPRLVPRRRCTRQEFEQRVRIARPERRVGR